MKNRSPSGVKYRRFTYRQREFDAWVSAHGRWWPKRKDPSVWGPFAAHAESGRYTFSHVNQPNCHFGETLVASILEQEAGLRFMRDLFPTARADVFVALLEKADRKTAEPCSK